MAIGLVFGEDVVKIIRAYAPQSGKLDAEKQRIWRVSEVRQTQMNWCWDWEISMVMLGNVGKDLKVYMEGME